MCFTDDITFINNIFNKDFPLTHLAYDIQVKIYQIQIRFENYFRNYFRIFTITHINTEAVTQTCSVKKVFLEISENSQENTCTRVSFLIKFQTQARPVNFEKTFFHRTPPVAASINSISLRDLSHNQLMKLVKNTRFHNQIAFTELNYHFKMSLNFTHTKKNILNEYSISISNQSIISKRRFDFKRKLRFKNSISNRVFISKSTLNFVIEVGTLT